jgi:hypothetical protein
MSRVDELIEKGADWLDAQAERNRGANGWKAKLADELADDAVFLRKLKPSLIRARAKGEAPTDQKPGDPVPGAPPPKAPSQPQLGARPVKKEKSAGGGGPSPFLVLGAALAAGIVLAKIVDWRGHAHPRD